MKGIELPINVLIIIAVAIIVLIAIVALFYPNFKNSSITVNSDIYKSSACQIMIDRQCTPSPKDIAISNFDANKDEKQVAGSTWTFGASGTKCGTASTGNDNLASLCACYYSIGLSGTDADGILACKRLCGCTV
jgi:hypothetical protein